MWDWYWLRLARTPPFSQLSAELEHSNKLLCPGTEYQLCAEVGHVNRVLERLRAKYWNERELRGKVCVQWCSASCSAINSLKACRRFPGNPESTATPLNSSNAAHTPCQFDSFFFNDDLFCSSIFSDNIAYTAVLQYCAIRQCF